MNSSVRLASTLMLALSMLLHGVAFARSFVVEAQPLPVTHAAAEPDLVRSPSGQLLLSWVEKYEGGHELRFSRFGADAAPAVVGSEQVQSAPHWQAPQTIAAGKDWFVNWADTPHLAALSDGTLWAHWLRRNGAGAYDYGIALVRSNDNGRSWSAPIRVEPEGASNDYGFVAMWEQAGGSLGLVWLDSRQKAASSDAHGGEHAGHADGAMMMRAATFDAQGRREGEWPLDLSTCDCCTTSAAISSRGPVIAYRGRTKDEIRDTRLVRFDGKHWTKPVTVHADGWHFAGCPVNGPSVAANGNDVWVAWYTEADGKPSLRLARSSDAGDTFGKPIMVAEGEGVLGRAALAIDAESIWIAWMIERADGSNTQELMLERINSETGKVMNQSRVAELSARGRASGLPRMQLHEGAAWLVWTDVIDGKPALRAASVKQP